MKGISVDPEGRHGPGRGGGSTWGEFDQATQLYGLATTGGRATTTGVAGQTLGSGSGWLERRLRPHPGQPGRRRAGHRRRRGGPGQRRREPGAALGPARRRRQLRGGHVASSSRLHPVGPVVLGGMMIYPRARAAAVLRFWRDYVETAEDEFGSAAAILTAPPAPFVPEHLHGPAHPRPHRLLRRVGGRGRGSGPSLPAASVPRSTSSRPCRTRPFRRCSTPRPRPAGRTTGRRRTSPPCPTPPST